MIFFSTNPYVHKVFFHQLFQLSLFQVKLVGDCVSHIIFRDIGHQLQENILHHCSFLRNLY